MIKLKVKYVGEKDSSVPNSYKLFFDVIPNKIYEVLSVEKGWYRIVDESDEDYLYPPEKFEVVEVLPNDNMIVEGTQSIWQNRDEHKITLRGIIRRDDVLMDNTVPSYKVADATIKFDGKGPLNAKQRQGILTQIFNFLF